MKLVTIKFQKKFLFVPIVNVVLIFFFDYNCAKANLSKDKRKKSNLYFLAYTFTPALLYAILIHLFPTLSNLIVVLGIYLIPIIAGSGFIRFQEKYIPQSK